MSSIIRCCACIDLLILINGFEVSFFLDMMS